MKFVPTLALFLAGTVLAGCSSDAIQARRNEAEVMYRVPTYPSSYADEDEVVYVQPSYRTIPAECDELIYEGDGYYCDRD